MKNKKLFDSEIIGWAFYDFANSAFSTTVSAVIFSVYFVQAVVGPEGYEILGRTFAGPTLWSFSISFSMLLILLTAPALGAISDYSSSRKAFLFAFFLCGVLGTFALFWAQPGWVWWAILFFCLSNIGLEGSLPFYNAFLSEITEPSNIGRVSGFGWALGYIGGVLCLILNLMMMSSPEWFGIPARDDLPIRISLIVVAIWWALFSIPTFLLVRERVPAQRIGGGVAIVRAGFRQFISTLGQLRNYPQLIKFLFAYFFYNDGIQTVIVMASVFAAEVIGMGLEELVYCYIFIQAIAFLGALLFGFLADRMATKSAIQITLYIWIAAVLFALFIDTAWQFWVLGGIIGVVMGGSQSASRALAAHFTPKENSAQFFGFFATCQKSSSVLGPALFGIAVELTGSTQYAIGTVAVFFILGLALLRFVDEEEGIRESHRSIESTA